MINCEYCGNVSSSDQVCTECGEPLVDNPVVDWAEEEFDGQPDERQEWADFMGGDDNIYEWDCDLMFDCQGSISAVAPKLGA